MKNRCATKTAARITTAVLLSAALNPAWAWDAGRMTGGGSIYCPAPIYRLTFGYELHCELENGPISLPNNLEVNFASGEHFHLSSLDSAVCSGPATSRPNAPFTTLDGSGTGTLNGEPATIVFQLVDNAEPGAGQDTARFSITSGGTTYSCGPLLLEGGNNQAHRATGNKP